MKVPSFYSIYESGKPASQQVHHDNSVCEPGKLIPIRDRINGTGGYRLCKDCQESDNLGH